jgi:16S rRNA (guanine966-N2)-methyltransferase
MRIIAGTAGGIPLLAPPLPARPTMDRVREAVFSSLCERVPGSRVLDLFGGCGSYALEALSRGAKDATIVENNHRSLASLRANLQKSRLSASVISADVFQFLKQADRVQYDLVFADPPYVKRGGDEDLAARLLLNEEMPTILATDGLLVLETHSGWKMPEGNGWRVALHRRYGDAGIRFLTREGSRE